MSDWEEEIEDATDKETTGEPKKQAWPQRNWLGVVKRGASVPFGVRNAGRERTDGRGDPGLPATGDRGRAFRRSRVPADTAGGRGRGRGRPLVFSVEDLSAGRIIGKLEWP